MGDILFTALVGLAMIYFIYRLSKKHRAALILAVILAFIFSADASKHGLLARVLAMGIYTAVFGLIFWIPSTLYRLFHWQKTGGTTRTVQDGSKERTIYFEDVEEGVAVDIKNREIRLAGAWHPATIIKSVKIPKAHEKSTVIYLNDPALPIYHYYGWARKQHERFAEGLNALLG